MADMKSFSERFRVEKVNASGDVERVMVQIGLDGLKIMNADGTRTNSSYELSHVSRWSMRGNNLILYTKTPVDVEERSITLRSSETAIRNVMDTLTCCCMQLSEILQSTGKSSSDRETANSLHQLVKGNGKKTPSLPNADEVEFWRQAEKQGYLQSQGDVTKFWRRRFFVLKQGYLFRFMSGDINENAKPRGVVDLSKVTDVVDGRAATGKANSIKLATSTGYVCYVADSETEMVEWMSALEGAVQRIVKHVAGITEEDAAPSRASRPLSPGNDWVKQLQSSLDTSTSSSSHRPPPSSSRYQMVDIVGYDNPPATAPPASSSYGGGSSSYGGGAGSYAGGGGNGYGDTIDYSQISGIAGVANDAPASNPANDLYLNYGGPPSSSAAPQQTPSYPSSYPTSAPPAYPCAAPAAAYPDASSSYYSSQGQAPSYTPQQPPSYQATSLIDAVPHQAPSYPYYQQTPASSSYPSTQQASAPAPAAPAANGSWQVLYTPDGKSYYHNPSTGLTQWEAPPGY